MAIYHLTASKGQQGKQSARAKFAYIDRQGKYQNPDRVAGGSGNMPAWADTPADYWQAADKFERANGRLFRSYEFALPKELTQKARGELAAQFCAQIANSQEGPLPYSFAVHEGAEGENPHCHLIVSERVNDGIARTADTWFKRANKKAPEKGGAVKAESLERKERLFEIRKEWADLANQTLEQAGIPDRIDHRTLAEQGINRPPQLHIGPHVLEMEAKGIITDKGTKANERYREIERGEELASIGRADRAIGAEHGRTSGRSLNDHEGNQKDIHGRSSGNADGLEAPENFSAEILRGSRFDSPDNCDSSAMRIIALADPLRDRSIESRDSGAERPDKGQARTGEAGKAMAEHGKQSQEHGRGQQSPLAEVGHETNHGKGLEKADRTTEAVKNQVRAMGCARFEIGVKNDKGMMNREYTAEEVIKAVPWLKRMNAQGNEIYIRPARDEQSALVLLDDLEPITLEEMREQGLAPAAIIETSHRNCQAWVKLGKETLTDALRADIAKKLAKDWGADPASAESRHYGRLAGFTNRKEKHLTERGFPFVLCRSSSGEIAQNGAQLVQEARGREIARQKALETAEQARQLEAQAKAQTRERLDGIKKTAGTWERLVEGPAAKFQRYFQQWLDNQQGNKPDWSKGDYAVACRMLTEHYRQEDVIAAIVECSPSIDLRKQGHALDYAQRTVANAQKEIDAERARNRQEQEQKRQKVQTLSNMRMR